jgi:hypothetical protein
VKRLSQSVEGVFFQMSSDLRDNIQNQLEQLRAKASMLRIELERIKAQIQILEHMVAPFPTESMGVSRGIVELTCPDQEEVRARMKAVLLENGNTSVDKSVGRKTLRRRVMAHTNGGGGVGSIPAECEETVAELIETILELPAPNPFKLVTRQDNPRKIGNVYYKER